MFTPFSNRNNLNSLSNACVTSPCNLSQYLLNLNSCMYAVPTLPSLYELVASSAPVGKYELGIRKPRTSLLVKYLRSSISPRFVPPGKVSTFEPLPSAVCGKK